MQGESLLARKRIALELVERLREKDLALAQRGAEALFLGKDHAADELTVFHNLRVDRAHELHDLIDVVVQERPFDADHVRLLDGATKQAAQHVAATLVGGQDAVGDHERDRTAVVGDDAQRFVHRRVLLVGLARQALAHADEAAEHVGVVVVGNALHDGGDALEAHAGVDVLGEQRCERAVFLAVELGEHAVPELEVAVAIAAGLAVGAAAADFGTLVEVDLGAGTAGAGGAGAPEVIVLAEARDVVLGNAERLPDLNRLVVILEHREVELLRRQAEHLGGELEGPGAHLVLEVLAEAEVAHHLEERQVTRVADVVDVVGTHALLRGRGADVGWVELLLVEEVGLELHHAGARQKQRRVVGDERGGRHALASLLLEEGEVLLADFCGGHVLHGGCSSLITQERVAVLQKRSFSRSQQREAPLFLVFPPTQTLPDFAPVLGIFGAFLLGAREFRRSVGVRGRSIGDRIWCIAVFARRGSAQEEHAVLRDEASTRSLLEIIHENGFRDGNGGDRGQHAHKRARKPTHRAAKRRARHEGDERERRVDVDRVGHDLRRDERVDELLDHDGTENGDDGDERAHEDADDRSETAAQPGADDRDDV